MKTTINLTTLLFLIISVCYAQDEYLPSHILSMDSKHSHHVILVEKSSHKLFIYENDGTQPKLLKTYPAATGKFKGDKLFSGDHRTPEGIYFITEFLSKSELLQKHGKYGEIYGVGAFPLNYPNFIDQKLGKTGGGIWLHSTDNDQRVFKGLDSRGCVVVQNQDLKNISEFIDLTNTPVIITQDITFHSRAAWELNRKELKDFFDQWSSAWQKKDFKSYISFYDAKKFSDSSKGSYNSYKSYKQAVFSRPDSPSIKFENISILVYGDYAVVTGDQIYRSAVINDIGKKSLYLQKDEHYDWKIVGELWSKIDKNSPPFTPSKRFF